ncbi:MAG: SH3 domain-containing protein [Lachnospiraceae bacterium]|nr:SH3 domain-containing protein [Lachnospiraceae bacterium]
MLRTTVRHELPAYGRQTGTMSKISDNIKAFPKKAGQFILKYSKYFFPGFALIIAAVIVVVSLDQHRKAQEREAEKEAQALIEQQEAAAAELEDMEVPLEESGDEKLEELVNAYYECLSSGDIDTLETLCDTVDESEAIRLSEQSAFVDYRVENIYSQGGPEEGSYIAYAYYMAVFPPYPEIELPGFDAHYIRTDEEGNLFIVKGELTDEENDYITKISNQDDVRELNNKVNVEYNEILMENPDLLNYFLDLDTTVSTAVGEKIAQLNATNEAEAEPAVEEGAEQDDQTDSAEAAEPATLFVTTTTRVNVRASDSANAERVGEAMEGERFELVEELLNGWTKIKYGDGEAFIKSDYLSVIQSSEGQPTIGMLTAREEVNIRSLPDTNSERVGALIAGDQLEIVAIEDGWVTVKFENMLAYVNADYVDCTLFEE